MTAKAIIHACNAVRSLPEVVSGLQVSSHVVALGSGHSQSDICMSLNMTSNTRLAKLSSIFVPHPFVRQFADHRTRVWEVFLLMGVSGRIEGTGEHKSTQILITSFFNEKVCLLLNVLLLGQSTRRT